MTAVTLKRPGFCSHYCTFISWHNLVSSKPPLISRDCRWLVYYATREEEEESDGRRGGNVEDEDEDETRTKRVGAKPARARGEGHIVIRECNAVFPPAGASLTARRGRAHRQGRRRRRGRRAQGGPGGRVRGGSGGGAWRSPLHFPRFSATRRFGSLDAIDAGARPRQLPRRAVRGGADPALRAPPREKDKVYTWFAIGFQEAEKVCSKFTCQYANEERKFTLMPKKFTSEVTKQPKKFTFMQKKFTFIYRFIKNRFSSS